MAPFGKDETHHRYFFHLRCDETPPQTWRHVEEFALGGEGLIVFEFFWAPLPDGIPPLIVGQGAQLPALLRSLGLAPS